jgi:GDP-L-fucose synthase
MQCQAFREQHGCDFISAMPTNLYGPGDNFDLEGAHVLPALLRRFRTPALAGDGKVTIWGTGTPRREFLHVDDCADALMFLLRHYSDAMTINVGVGQDVTIAEVAHMVADVVGFKGEIGFDASRPDGTPRKLLDVSRLTALGWRARIGLKEGGAPPIGGSNSNLPRVIAHVASRKRRGRRRKEASWAPIIEHHASAWRR